MKKRGDNIGLFDYVFGKKKKEKEQINRYFSLLSGYSPVFTTFDGSVYEMDLTRTAINTFATHCSKLKPEIEGEALKHLEKTLQFKPNFFMDTTKFLARVATILECEHTVFIIPIEDRWGELCGWYPIRPQYTELIEHNEKAYLRYNFANGEKACIEYEKVGVLTTHQYKNDIVGEDNDTLQPTLQLIQTTNEGIINAVKNSANIRFLAKVGNILSDEDIKAARDDFTSKNLTSDNKSGMLVYDNKFENLEQIDSKPYTPNALQMQQIQENVCTHFGTNMDILQNKFNEETWGAYYEGKIEPFALQLSLVMSNMSLSLEQLADNVITFSANRLQYASNSTKLQVSTQLFDRGLINRNSVMDIWNMPHVEDGDKYYIRREYTEVDQLKKDELVNDKNESKEQDTKNDDLITKNDDVAAGEEDNNG